MSLRCRLSLHAFEPVRLHSTHDHNLLECRRCRYQLRVKRPPAEKLTDWTGEIA